MGVFPGIAVFFAGLLGVQSPVNLVYLVIIFLLVVKVFLQDQDNARTESKLVYLTQTYAIDQKEKNEEGEK